MGAALEISVLRVRGGTATATRDAIAVERPLEIRGWLGGAAQVISTTMRTPGEDVALAAGFLFAERAIADAAGIRRIEEVEEDAVLVELAPEAEAALAACQRQFVTSAACGVCGRTSLESLLDVKPRGGDPHRPRLSPALIHLLPARLRDAQATFERTGGLHAAGLFTPDGTLRAIHEDVGRHNAVDKLVGRLLLDRRLPIDDGVLVVSGRASFELVQKAAVAGFPVLAAVGAPSSLAVDVAAAAGMTLLGFVRDSGFNVYAGHARVADMEASHG